MTQKTMIKTITKTKECLVCKKSFNKNKDLGFKLWEKQKYCSLDCYRKIPRSEEVKKRISKTCINKGVGRWTIGTKRSVELRIRHSQFMKEWVASGGHNFWKGGISEQTRTFRANFQNTIEYRLWRTAVFQKDNYTCIWCGARNGEGKAVVLNADHIKSFAEYPELRLEVSNGRTLCRKCHYKRHSKRHGDIS